MTRPRPEHHVAIRDVVPAVPGEQPRRRAYCYDCRAYLSPATPDGQAAADAAAEHTEDPA